MKSFQGAYPKFQVRVHWVFYHYRDVYAFQRFRDFLYCERIYGGSCTNPKHINPIFQSQFYVSCISYFCGDWDIQVMSYDFHPLYAVFTDALEASRSGSWFPDTGTEDGRNRIFLDHVQTYFFNLFWGLRAARACDDYMAV